MKWMPFMFQVNTRPNKTHNPLSNTLLINWIKPRIRGWDLIDVYTQKLFVHFITTYCSYYLPKITKTQLFISHISSLSPFVRPSMSSWGEIVLHRSSSIWSRGRRMQSENWTTCSTVKWKKSSTKRNTTAQWGSPRKTRRWVQEMLWKMKGPHECHMHMLDSHLPVRVS